MEESEKTGIAESRKRTHEEEDGENHKAEAEKVSAKRPNNQTTVYFKVLVPSTAAGAIIGKGGEAINQLQADTATNIKMSKGGDFFPGTTDRVCMIIGSVDNVRKVHSSLLDKIKEKPDPSSVGAMGEVKTKIVVPNNTASLIIGKNGDNINSIKAMTNAAIQVSPKSANSDKPLSERIISINGDPISVEKAVDLILIKIVEDPQSGTCTNVSYTDGLILPQNAVSSLFSTNLTSSLHLPVTGHPTMEALKFILRAKGYNEPATREITAAMYTLASYGFLMLRPPAMPQGNQEWPSVATATATNTASETGATSDYCARGADPGGLDTGAAAMASQMPDQNSYANYYNNYYSAGNSYGGNGYNAGGGGGGGGGGGAAYDNGSGYGNTNSYGNSGMPMSGMQDMSGYSMGAQGGYAAGYNTSTAAGGNYPTNPGNYSMGGGNFQGGNYGSGNSSSGAQLPPNSDANSVTQQEIDVGDHVLQAIMGQEGKGMMELQHWCGVNIEMAQKAPYLHTLKVTGLQNAVQSAMYTIHQYIQHAEYKRYYEGQAAQ